MALDPAFKVKWLAALRSGEYEQCKSRLTDGKGFCCLGVAAKVMGYEIHQLSDTVLHPGETIDEARDSARSSYDALNDFGLCNRGDVISMNDGGNTFEQIADYVQRNM